MDQKKAVFNFELKQLDDIDDNYVTFEGYAATYGNIDMGRDVIVPGAFDATLAKRGNEPFPILWQHDKSTPVGIFTSVKSDDAGLYVSGRMPKADDFVRGRILPQLKVGSVRKLSIGYSVKDYETVGNTRVLKDIELWEVSLVTLPMNPKAAILAVKAATSFEDLPLAPIDTAWDSVAAVARLREFTNSLEEPTEDYRMGFFWYDAENPLLFGSYKLPFTDVIGDELVAVPRGIFAAAAAMRGARGGVDIPEDDIAAVTAHIERYYAKMGRESPFEKGFSPDEIKSVQLSDFERLLKSGVKFSNSGAKFIAAKVKAGAVGAASIPADGIQHLKNILNTLNRKE